jgi:tetratricopeptide (TPR) repeat protein
MAPLARVLAAVAVATMPIAALPAVDVASLWDFAQPEVSEARFRERLKDATPDDAAILLTQIARTYGLRRDFDRARSTLAPLQTDLARRSAEVRARYHLERGRTFISATHRADEKTAEARAVARREYLAAVEIARANARDDIAIDALHMLPFVETDEAAGLRWNRQALALAQQSCQPAARRWEASLRNNIGLSLHRLGRPDEALAMFEAAVPAAERTGDARRVRIAHWMVAWTLRSLGRVDEALAIQQRLERENDAAGTPDPHVYDELAKLHEAKGDAARAAHYASLAAARHRPAAGGR